MGTYFARRFLMIIPTLLGVTFIVFMITRFVPGGPVERAMQKIQQGGATAGEGGVSGGGNSSGISEKQQKALEKQFGFDKSPPVAYFDWLSRTVQGELGESYFNHQPVLTLIKERLPISLTFGLTGFILS